MKGDRVAAFGRPHPRRSLSDDGDLLAGKTRLVADHGAGAALALQAVAHGNARWFALNRKVKLPAAAGGASGHGSTPWLSIWAGVYAGLRNDAPWAAESYDQLMSANGTFLPFAALHHHGSCWM
jgi:hypothetical protein